MHVLPLFENTATGCCAPGTPAAAASTLVLIFAVALASKALEVSRLSAGSLSQLDLRVASLGALPGTAAAGNETPDAGQAPARASSAALRLPPS